MPEHYTTNTMQAAIYCIVCSRMTMHGVDYGGRGPCLDSNGDVRRKRRPLAAALDSAIRGGGTVPPK